MSDDKDKRTGWLRTLQVGDVVAVSRPHSPTTLCKVERITHTGGLRAGGIEFNPYGRSKGPGVVFSALAPPSSEVREGVLRNRLEIRLHALLAGSSLAKVSTENMKQAAALLTPKGEETPE
jgi:hypothetical protein